MEDTNWDSRLSDDRFTKDFIVRYGRERAKLIVEKLERDIHDREIFLDEKDIDGGVKFKFFYRTSPKHRLVTNFEFACISIGDVNYMGEFMTKVWSVWKKNLWKKEDKKIQEWREATSMKRKRSHSDSN